MQKDFHKVDEILRQRLANLPDAAPNAAGWKRLEDALVQDPDFALRTALVGLAAEDDVTGWGALERKLDPAAPADVAIASGLNALTPSAPAGSWAALSEKIDDAFGAEIDQVVSQRLEKTTTGSSSGWAALAARLELISHRRHLVGAWKVTEFSLLLSLMLLLLRFGPEFPLNPESSPLAVTEAGFEMEETIRIKPETPSVIPEETIIENVTPTVIPTTDNSLAVASEQPVRLQRSVVVAAIARAGKVAEISNDLILPTVEIDGADPTLPLQPIASPEYTANWVSTLPSPTLALPEIDNSIPVRYRLNLFVAPSEINQVITPQNSVLSYKVAPRKWYSYSTSLGVLLNVGKGKDQLEVGAIYSQHDYTPTDLIGVDCFVQGNCPEAYDRFSYHSVSFPFAYERTLFERNDWRIGARGGMAMSVITKSEFRLVEGTNEQELEMSLQAPSNGRGNTTPPPVSDGSGGISLSQIVAPPAGWFEGGSILQNASFYLSGGFTVERFVTPRFSLYVSPIYSRVIYLDRYEGIGPYNDRIHRASVRFGSRFLLGGK